MVVIIVYMNDGEDDGDNSDDNNNSDKVNK